MWVDEPKIDVGDPLRHDDVGVVRRTRMAEGSLGFERTFKAIVFSLASLMLVGSLYGSYSRGYTNGHNI